MNAWVVCSVYWQESTLDRLCPQIHGSYRQEHPACPEALRAEHKLGQAGGEHLHPSEVEAIYHPDQLPSPTYPLHRFYEWASFSISCFLRYTKLGLVEHGLQGPQTARGTSLGNRRQCGHLSEWRWEQVHDTHTHSAQCIGAAPLHLMARALDPSVVTETSVNPEDRWQFSGKKGTDDNSQEKTGVILQQNRLYIWSCPEIFCLPREVRGTQKFQDIWDVTDF